MLVNPDYTTERMLAVLRLLRGEYHFGGYIHAKAIPGTSPELLEQLGFLADRLSVNIELPSERSLNLLAPDKGRHSIFRPMKQIAAEGPPTGKRLALYRKAPRFAPAGQSTQMIVGASPETDYHILQLTEGLYNKYHLKTGLVFTLRLHIPVDRRTTRLPRWTPSRRCCGSIGSIRQTGCSAFTSSRQRNFWTGTTPTSTPIWTPNATGRCSITGCSRWT